MIERFRGESGKALLVKALMSQFIIRGNEHVARKFAEVINLKEYASGEIILSQGATDNDLHFVISGRVVIRVKNRNIAFRSANTHIGEMGMIDPSASRSATAIAVEPTITGIVREEDFFSIANESPAVWRYLGIELADRLRQRNNFVREPNVTPRLFLGSSKESIPIMNQVVAGLDASQVIAVPWTGDIFYPSHSAIEDLEKELPKVDFGVLIFGPDDEIVSRGIAYEGPRDNVLLEFGMFLGAIGRDRTYFLKPKRAAIKQPSDIFGLLALEYEHDATNGTIDVADACRKIMRCVEKYGVQ